MVGLIIAWACAVAATVGSLYLSLGLGYVACPLCFYQRMAAFGLVGILSVGLALPNRMPGRLSLQALPLALGGACVAGFHLFLVSANKLECPLGIEGFGTAPSQSLVALGMATIALFATAFQEVNENRKKTMPALLLAIVLGLAIGFGSLVANPSPKKADRPRFPNEPILQCQIPFPTTNP
ncbi:MAG: disulfide bond formation protein B [Gemmataceae bacterium]